MMHLQLDKVRFKKCKNGLTPINEHAKIFLESLPQDARIKLELNIGSDKNIDKTLLYPDDFKIVYPDDEPDGDYNNRIRLQSEIMFEHLREKTNISDEIKNDLRNYIDERHEEFSSILRFYLHSVRNAEGSTKGPNFLNLLSRGEITYFATSMLRVQLMEKAPHLYKLINSLLNNDKAQQKFYRIAQNNFKKYRAYRYRYVEPKMSIRKIAKKVQVNPSTVSRWFNSIDAEKRTLANKYSGYTMYYHWSRNKDFTPEQLAKKTGIPVRLLQRMKQGPNHEKWLNATWD